MAKVSIAGSDDLAPPPSTPFSAQLLTQGGPEIVVPPVGADIRKVVSDEAFLNEMIEIRCKSTGDRNAPKAVEITINTGGVTGPMGKPTEQFPDGVPGRPGAGGQRKTYVFALDKTYRVPRFVYEALAHSKMTTLSQMPHPADPMQMMHVNRSTFSYSFECVRDDNPKGQPWREKVLADAA